MSDDTEPVTQEWLKVTGLEFSDGHEDYSPEPQLAFGKFDHNIGIVWWNDEWQVVVQSETDQQCTLTVVATRGDVRRLCSALGITLSESS